MCLAIPARVVAFADAERQLAKVDVSGVRRNVHAGLLTPDGLEVGDWVLLHVGIAIARIDEQQAADTLAFLEQLGAPFGQELAELSESDVE